MKNKSILIPTTMGVMLFIGHAYAFKNCNKSSSCQTILESCVMQGMGNNCATSETIYYYNIGFISCKSCDTNGELTKKSDTPASGCTITPTYYTCACKRGYYSGSNGCVRCPSSGGIYGTTAYSSEYNTITDCYIPSGQNFTDATGTYSYTNNCYYKN